MSEGPNPLEKEIRRLITVAGPMPVAEYMNLCLAHPAYGYYVNRDPLGSAGDFITAPEISQMFGELIGLWAAAVWQQMGAPENVRLVELGPGRGTMMRDALRAAQVVPRFHAALVAHLVEVSPVLRERQRRTLESMNVPMLWHDSLDEVPGGPMIILANEFFDALPVHQSIKREDGWHERVVEIDSVGNLAFGIGEEPIPHFDRILPRRLRDAPVGAIFEWRPDRSALEVGHRVMHGHGAALIIDYGHAQSGTGDTLQAVGAHSFADPLVAPGLVDLTAHVDFEALGQAAELIGTLVFGPVDQGEFLTRLGIVNRAAALRQHATGEQRRDIDSGLQRLTDPGRNAMGRLFKVMGLAHPDLGELPGFET